MMTKFRFIELPFTVNINCHHRDDEEVLIYYDEYKWIKFIFDGDDVIVYESNPHDDDLLFVMTVYGIADFLRERGIEDLTRDGLLGLRNSKGERAIHPLDAEFLADLIQQYDLSQIGGQDEQFSFT